VPGFDLTEWQDRRDEAIQSLIERDTDENGASEREDKAVQQA
jgi:hypothetical protein